MHMYGHVYLCDQGKQEQLVSRRKKCPGRSQGVRPVRQDTSRNTVSEARQPKMCQHAGGTANGGMWLGAVIGEHVPEAKSRM